MFLACHIPCFHFSFTILILEFMCGHVCVCPDFWGSSSFKEFGLIYACYFSLWQIKPFNVSDSCTMNPNSQLMSSHHHPKPGLLLLRRQVTQDKSYKIQAPPPHPWVTCRRILDTKYHDFSLLFVFDLFSTLFPPLWLTTPLSLSLVRFHYLQKGFLHYAKTHLRVFI